MIVGCTSNSTLGAMSSAQDVFRILDIAWNNEQDLEKVDESLVKRQYRRLALKLHPDKNKGDPNAEVKFHQLKTAHDSMMNEAKRAELLAAIRALLQRKKERLGRDADKQRFADDLERREAEYASASTVRDDLATIRARHRMMVEQLQVKRNLARAGAAKSTHAASSTLLGGPDDSNTDLEYWITYGLNESEAVRREKAQKFSAFISQQLSA